ncbi:MAG: ATP-dependent DNA helicase RecG [Rhodospirillaceae bacterium]|jgi:ATP-dependent DNA helicase RecG|nr:ATP-dependent DNA helicase RecG [Rhodospirillaceae bacterium]
MRPEILFSLFKPVTSLKGVGPRIGNLIEKLAGLHLVNLLWHLPSGLIDRRYAPKIADAETGAVATITVRVLQHRKPPNKRLPYKIICADDTGEMSLVFFHAHEDYLTKSLPEGELRVVSGQIDRFGQEIQMSHPDHIGTLDELEKLKTVEPVYPLTTGLTLKVLGRSIAGALQAVPELPEWADASYVTSQKWLPWKQALLAAHAPDSEAALGPEAPARARLAYDELFANQVALALIRRHMREARGRPIQGTGALRARVAHSLPFELTQAQQQALKEITADLTSDARMLRLLQGDVGSGKTIVALMAMLIAVEAGAQAVLMAPTEILARQHLATIEPLAKAAGLRTVVLTGRERGKSRAAILDALSSGAAQLAIGTHALFQDDVDYKHLAVAVIDEQHRFGVHQRLTLASKGHAVDVLVMTATPIPRTLMLTAYGDMDVSRLMEKPPGRQPIDTRAVPLERLNEVTGAIGRAVETGNKVYWVCPLVEESDTLDVAAVEQRHAHLQQLFGERVGVVHGKMSGVAKDKVMAAFSGKALDILVATTVIEVGVDVPDATVMVVEHAERFGLAQLHQLRGRIGRGDKPSTCLLLYAAPLTETARARLKVMRETDDGFVIAEEDLKLRGAGELLGTRQSGMPDFLLADLQAHAELFVAARDDAALLLDRDPELESERGQAVRNLLYLFERDAAVRYLRSG